MGVPLAVYQDNYTSKASPNKKSLYMFLKSS